MNPTLLIASAETTQTPNASHVGGKAFHLFELKRRGFPVPPFFAISVDAWWQFVAAVPELAHEIDRLTDTPPNDADDLLASIQAKIRTEPMPAAIRQAIESEYERIAPDDRWVAVRSSATDEDGAHHSFAGMHDSFLFIRGGEEVIASVRNVWASGFNKRAMAYRFENQIDTSQIAVGVVVQEMIQARTSGVVFTINPANDHPNELVISSLWGTGEGLVSAGLPADTFTVNKTTRQIASEIVEKETQLVINQETKRGLATLPVDPDRQHVASLSDAQVREVAQTAIAIENAWGRPQDIEFCIDPSGALTILQSRPITRVKEYGPAAGNRIVWDNSNIIESYSGVTTPMTFSFIRRAYTIVYHCFAEVMGIPPAQVKQSRHVFENMLGLIRGRVYYNLQNWYRLIRLFPGFQYNAPFMESMMGIKEPLVLDDPLPTPTFFRKWFVELPALGRLAARGTWNFIRIRPIVDRFQSNFRTHYDRWDAMDFDALAPHEIKSLYDEMEEALLWDWKAPIINDFYVMIFYGMLKRYCQSWCHDTTGALQNDLICGEGGIESAEPAKMLLQLASIASQSPPLKRQIMECPLDQLPEQIKQTTEFESFNRLMATYLHRYGVRCMNELKLEEHSLRDRPEVVYQVLRNYLSLDDSAPLDVETMHQREQNIRREAETLAFSRLRGLRAMPRKIIFKRVLRNARQGVKNRENMRFARTRIYGLLRELLRALGRKMADEQIIADPEDIFYLTIDECWDWIQGTAVTTDLDRLARLRREEFARFESEPSPDDRFETYGFVYHKNLFVDHNTEPVTLESGQLRGTGCCPGVVTNTVRVLRSPSDDLSLSGEILVAERTDPGWVPLYPAVSGILIERGSILSHSAVVAREMGIPTIVGIAGLLAHVADGDHVTMNGSSGVVELDHAKKVTSSVVGE